MRNINEIIIHCSATKEGKHFTVEDIDRWHKERGWKGIGYHYVIYLDGSIHKGRPDEEIGAHTVNHNKNSIGICYIGGLNSKGISADTRTEEQKESLRNLIEELKQKYPITKVSGHYMYANKACPCFDVEKEL